MSRTLATSPVRRSAPSPVPLKVGTRRAQRQRYASTHLPTMRNVTQRATVALVGITLSLVSLWWVASAPSLADQCASVTSGTDSVPADILDICSAQQ